MLSAKDLSGVFAMMPAFATSDAVDVRAKETIAVDNLKTGVDKIIKDGIDAIATTGTYGECYNILWDEFKTLTMATVDAVKKRVPLFIGCTCPNPREVIEKMEFIKDSGADGVLLGVPYYEMPTVEDVIQFYRDMAELFPTLNIIVYHNPENHRFTFPISSFTEISKIPTIIGMKDSNSTTGGFMQLQKIIKDKISVFVTQGQLYPYYQLGAAGCWSTEVWMGPWPVLHLRDLVRRGDNEGAQALTLEMMGASGGRPRPGEGRMRPQVFADYCNVGPTRVPFVHFPPEQVEKAKRRAAYWMKLCEKYRPLVEAERSHRPA